MKLTLDPYMFRHTSLLELPALVGDLRPAHPVLNTASANACLMCLSRGTVPPGSKCRCASSRSLHQDGIAPTGTD